MGSGFEGLPTDFFFTIHGASKTDWTDDCLMGRPGIQLVPLNINQICELGSDVMKGLMNGLSEKIVASSIILAWNLIKTTSEGRIFPTVDPTSTATDRPLETFSSEIQARLGGGAPNTIPYRQDPLLHARAMTYTCASLLRLITKPPGTFERAWPAVRKGFHKFYEVTFPYTWLHPSHEALVFIHRKFANEWSIYRRSITGFLYTHMDTEADVEMRQFLYEQHLSCAGMHAYKLFVGICDWLEVANGVLHDLLMHRWTEWGLKELALILKDFEGEGVDESRSRGTWKYARLFDDQYFKRLQTKHCNQLVYILAHLSKLAGIPEGMGGDVLQIVELKNIAECHKKSLSAVASRAYEVLLSKKK